MTKQHVSFLPPSPLLYVTPPPPPTPVDVSRRVVNNPSNTTSCRSRVGSYPRTLSMAANSLSRAVSTERKGRGVMEGGDGGRH